MTAIATTYFRSSVVRLGEEAALMIDGGVFILFAEPVPHELAEVSVIHRPSQPLSEEVRAGDVFVLGETAVEITAAGDRAAENLRTLGHIVVYLNPDGDQQVLPGAIHVTGQLTAPSAGDLIELRR